MFNLSNGRKIAKIVCLILCLLFCVVGAYTIKSNATIIQQSCYSFNAVFCEDCVDAEFTERNVDCGLCERVSANNLFDSMRSEDENVCQYHYILVGLLLLFIIYVFLLYFAFKVKRFKWPSIVGCALFLIAVGVLSIWNSCRMCWIASIVDGIVFVLAVLMFAFGIDVAKKEKKQKKDKKNNKEMLGGKEELRGITLRDVMALASTTVNCKFKLDKKQIALWLKKTYKGAVVSKERDNYAKSRKLLLADTHYIHIEGKQDICFAYVYEQDDGTLFVLLKMCDGITNLVLKKHPTIQLCSYPKFDDTNKWYALVIAEGFCTMSDLLEMMDRVVQSYFVAERKVDSGTQM